MSNSTVTLIISLILNYSAMHSRNNSEHFFACHSSCMTIQTRYSRFSGQLMRNRKLGKGREKKVGARASRRVASGMKCRLLIINPGCQFRGTTKTDRGLNCGRNGTLFYERAARKLAHLAIWTRCKRRDVRPRPVINASPRLPRDRIVGIIN